MNGKNNRNLEIKAKEYKIAIEKYNTIPWYTRVEFLTSIVVILLQAITLITLFQQYSHVSITFIIITLIVSYVATDFIGGIVHMIVDNTTNYTSFVGPFVAAFHLHHAKLTYQNKHPLKIYFYESGHKLWLVFYLLVLFSAQRYAYLPFCLNLFFVSIGILSSVSELAHFWCHNSAKRNFIVRFLQKHNVLLSMKHHRFHHIKDNTHYAFLNGMTDSILNRISCYFYLGYKNHSDKHVEVYQRQFSPVKNSND